MKKRNIADFKLAQARAEVVNTYARIKAEQAMTAKIAAEKEALIARYHELIGK